jgi:hypothetical protein
MKTKILTITAITIISIGLIGMGSHAFAAPPITDINGRGTGTFTCQDNTENTNLVFFINANKGKPNDPGGKLSGSWQLNSPDFSGQIQGGIFGGKISKTTYSFLATEFNSNGICPNDATPVDGTLTGQCGLGAHLQLRFDNGAHGEITANIICH